MAGDVLEILESQRAGSYGIVGQILLDGRGVIALLPYLLQSVAVLGVMGVLVDELTQLGLLG